MTSGPAAEAAGESGSSLAQGARGSWHGPYRALLSTPDVPSLFGWALLARLPLGMAVLGIVLLVRGSGGTYADAGAVTACYAVALAAGAPVAGRMLDRRGVRRVLLPRAIVCPLAFLGLALLAHEHAPLAALAVCAALAGALVPPVASALRVTWPRLLPEADLRATAYALDASLQELIFIAGPLLVAVLAATIAPAAALVAAAAAAAAGTIGFARRGPVRAWRPAGTAVRRRLVGALGSNGVRTVLAVGLGCGFGFGAIEVAMPAFAEAHGGRALAGAALACFSVGSLVGGLLAGARPGGAPRRRLRIATAALVAATALPLAATSLAGMCALVFAAGLPIAPTFASAYSLTDEVALPGTHAEAFAWIGTALSGGLALGTAAGGYALDASGVRAALLLGVGGAVCAALAANLRR